MFELWLIALTNSAPATVGATQTMTVGASQAHVGPSSAEIKKHSAKILK